MDLRKLGRLQKIVSGNEDSDDEPREELNIELLVENAVNGRSVIKNPTLEPPVSTTLRSIKPQINLEKTHSARIKLVKKYFSNADLLRLLDKLDGVLAKNAPTALTLKQMALAFYKKSNHEMAIRCSNLAILFAPNDWEESLTKIYANRAVFIHALIDLESNGVLLSLPSSPHFSDGDTEASEIHDRKIPSCLKPLRHENKLDPETEKRQLYCDDVLFSIHGGRNPKIPCGGNYIAIKVHPYKGRTVVVTQDVRPGTTVIVEEPFVSLLADSLKWELKHCAYCFKKTTDLTPCPSCVFAPYCSETCRLADYDGVHQYECSCLSYFHAVNLPDSVQMGFRAVVKAGPDTMYKMYKQEAKSKGTKGKEIKGFNPRNGMYESDSYYQVFHLESHSEERLEMQTWYSYAVTNLLDAQTNFFEKIKPKRKSSFLKFIASSILHHAVSFPFNALSVWKYGDAKKGKKSQTTPESDVMDKIRDNCAGLTGLYSLTSILCHSCDPTAFRVSLMNGKIAIITSRYLKAGEELTLSYGCKYSTFGIQYRREHLGYNFNFKCECVACEFNWPILDEMSQEIQYNCPQCSDKFTFEENARSRKSVLKIINKQAEDKEDFLECGNCKQVFTLSTLKKEVQKYENILLKATDLMGEKNPVDAVPLIVDAIEAFQHKIAPPSLHLIKAQVLLMSAYNSIVTSYGQ